MNSKKLTIQVTFDSDSEICSNLTSSNTKVSNELGGISMDTTFSPSSMLSPPPVSPVSTPPPPNPNQLTLGYLFNRNISQFSSAQHLSVDSMDQSWIRPVEEEDKINIKSKEVIPQVNLNNSSFVSIPTGLNKVATAAFDTLSTTLDSTTTSNTSATTATANSISESDSLFSGWSNSPDGLSYDEALKAKGLKRRSGRSGPICSMPECDEVPTLSSYYRLLSRQKEEEKMDKVEKKIENLDQLKKEKNKEKSKEKMTKVEEIKLDEPKKKDKGKRRMQLVRQDASDAGDSEADEFAGAGGNKGDKAD